jgi:hypothetical protein
MNKGEGRRMKKDREEGGERLPYGVGLILGAEFWGKG